MEKKRKQTLTRVFVHRAIWISTLLMLALTAGGLILYGQRETILFSRAARAAQRGDYEKAVTTLTAMEQPPKEQLLAYRYALGEQTLRLGDASGALVIFSQLGEYADSRTQVLACRYALAEQTLLLGDIEGAGEMFYALSGYLDARDRYDQCRYELAEQTAASDPETAFHRFLALGAYADARQRAEALAMELMGETDPTFAVNRMLGLTEEQVDSMKRLQNLRMQLPQGKLAVGFFHTVGLKGDGTVLATGRNEEGQCEVSGWTNVQTVACGAYHTVALLQDGTLMATGRNSEGQCEVSQWTNVQAVACGDYTTLALLSDGTLRTTGYQPYTELSGWKDMVALSAGSYGAVGIAADGRVYASHPSLRSKDMTGAVAVACSTGYAVALMEDGTVLHTAASLDWTDVLAVSACSTGTLAIDAQGHILCHWFRSRDALDFSQVSDAVALSAGGTHTAVLLCDGSVLVQGENGEGQCETKTWNLN